MALRIDGPTQGILSEAIENAIPSLLVFDTVLTTKLDDSVFNYSGIGTAYPQVRFKFIQEYNARHRIDELVIALLEHNPTNALLLDFAWQYHLLPGTSVEASVEALGGSSLEKMLDPVRGFQNPMVFLERFGSIVNQVCKITVPLSGGDAYGTGFLIGNQTVLTNYHVVEDVIKGTKGADRRTVKILFDYRTSSDGQVISPGSGYALQDNDEQWLVDFSPYHEHDLKGALSLDANRALERPDDHLDYAVLRLNEAIGDKPLGAKASEGGAHRGFINLLTVDDDSELASDNKEAAIFIFQHPANVDQNGKILEPSILPLRLDWEKPAILGMNRNRTRAYYDVNTRSGSSGSPCFNAKLELVALHHAGGKDWPANKSNLYNQGIPIGKIRKLLEKREKINQIV